MPVPRIHSSSRVRASDVAVEIGGTEHAPELSDAGRDVEDGLAAEVVEQSGYAVH